jgi:predicted GIY-YIG superfamily endonuclease
MNSGTIKITVSNDGLSGLVKINKEKPHNLALCVAPRTELKKSITTKEIKNKQGVYVLWSKSKKMLYVGKSDNIGNRLNRHDGSSDKDWFEKFFTVAHNPGNYGGDAATYLEYKFYEMGKNHKTFQLSNSNIVSRPSSIDDDDAENLDEEIEEMLELLSLVKIDIFKDFTSKSTEHSSVSAVRSTTDTEQLLVNDSDELYRKYNPKVRDVPFTISDKRNNYHATMYFRAEDCFVISAGSIISRDATPKALKIRENYDSFIDHRNYTIKQDISFTKPSTAEQFCTGRISGHGYDGPKAADGRSLKEFMNELNGNKRENK